MNGQLVISNDVAIYSKWRRLKDELKIGNDGTTVACLLFSAVECSRAMKFYVEAPLHVFPLLPSSSRQHPIFIFERHYYYARKTSLWTGLDDVMFKQFQYWCIVPSMVDVANGWTSYAIILVVTFCPYFIEHHQLLVSYAWTLPFLLLYIYSITLRLWV